MIPARDYVSNEMMKIPEYLVYCGIFIMRSWGIRSAGSAKGVFLEVPKIKIRGTAVPRKPALAVTHQFMTCTNGRWVAVFCHYCFQHPPIVKA